MGKVKIGIIGGTGLNSPDILEGGVEICVDTPFGMPSDVLIQGKIAGVDCVILPRHGRSHTISPSNVNYRANIWALKELKCTHVLVSNATGSLVEQMRPGDLVIVDSFIDRTQGRKSSFYDGLPGSPEGVLHMPMEPAFCDKTRQLLRETAEELGLNYHPSGTVVTIEGPRFSSKAESNWFRSMNASLVGMTLVPEVCLAREAGLLYASVAMVTDYDCWHDSVVNVETVLNVFQSNVEKIKMLFLSVIPKIAAKDWEKEVAQLQDLVEKSNQTLVVKKCK